VNTHEDRLHLAPVALLSSPTLRYTGGVFRGALAAAPTFQPTLVFDDGIFAIFYLLSSRTSTFRHSLTKKLQLVEGTASSHRLPAGTYHLSHFRYLAADLRRLSDMPSRRRLRSSFTDQLDVRQSQLFNCWRPSFRCGWCSTMEQSATWHRREWQSVTFPLWTQNIFI